MANTYKDIVVTPFRNDANNDPVIRFSAGDASTNSDMNVRFYATSNGTLSFEGTAGQLFSITNNLTGTLFSVNDISGIPSIEVDSNGKISMAHFGGNVGVGTSNAQYKLDVSGDMRVTGNVILGDASTDTITLNGTTISLGNNQNIDSGTLFIDATNNEVGIGTTNPTSNLHVIGTANITSNLVVQGADVFRTMSGANTAVGAGANAYSATIGAASNTYLLTTLAGANTAVGTGANTVGSAAFDRANTSNTVAIANVNYVNTAMQAAFAQVNVAVANINYVNTAMQAAFAKANTGGGGASVAVSDAAPPSPTANSLWWSSDLGKLFIYYNDGSSAQWVETSPSPDTTQVYTTANNALAVAENANSAVSAAFNRANAVANIAIVVDAVNAERYITFEDSTSGNVSTLNVSQGLKFTPSSNTLNVVGTIRDSKGDVRDNPVTNIIVGYGLTINDTGRTISTNTTVFVPNAVFFAGNTVSLYNNSALSITVTQNTSVTMYLAGTATTGNRTLAQRGVATILCVAANTFVISGSGLT